MDNQWKNLKAPPRSELDKQRSLKQIQQKVQKQNKKSNWQYIATLVSAAILLFILVSSFMQSDHTIKNATTANETHIKNIFIFEPDNLTHEEIRNMSKWYYLQKVALSENDIEQIKPYIDRLMVAPIQEKKQNFHSTLDVIVQYDDGTEHYLKVANSFYKITNQNTGEVSYKDFAESDAKLVNVDTNQQIDITFEDSFLFHDLQENNTNKLNFLIKIFLFIGAYALYMTLLRKVSPIRIEEDEMNKNPSTFKSFFRGLGVYIFIIILVGVSSSLFHAFNLLFIASTLSIIFVARFLYDYWNGKFYRSFWEIPISVIFYVYFTVLYIF